jgi:type I restriction enzyme S subunit
MDTQRLKDKILQLAIQGKLVEQNPEDEPASVLLEKIKEEKDKLVKEKKIRKPKKLPPIEEDEKPFELPKGWEWVRFGNIALINMGQSPKGKTVNDKEGMEFHQGKVCFGDRYINKSDKYTSAPKKIAQKGDVLVSVRAPVGDVNITDREICIGRGLCAISSLGNMMSEYYFYLISALKKHLMNKATGTTFLAITASTINEMLVPLPPLAEQKRIVEKVDQLFALIDELDSNKDDLLEAIKLSRNQVLQKAIQGKLVEQNPEDEPASVLLEKIEKEKAKLVKEKKIRKPKKLLPITEDEIPFDIPESWEWVRLGEIIKFRIGKTPKRGNVAYWNNGKYFWVTISDIRDGEVIYDTKEKISKKAYTEVFKNQISPKGTLIMSFKLSIGKMSILGVDAFHNEAIISIFPILDENGIIKMYLFKIMKGLDILGDAKDAVKGATLNSKSISNILLPLPPLAEQKRIVAKVDEIMALCDKLEAQIDGTKQ